MSDAGPINEAAVDRAARRLSEGGLVAFPTETVYGLGADALNETAVREVFALKGRPASNPLIVHVSSAEMARACAALGAWDEDAQKLAEAFWPGPVSIVVPRAAGIRDVVTAGGRGVAVRMPRHEVALALIERFGGPIVGPSANPSGRVSPTDAQHVVRGFGKRDGRWVCAMADAEEGWEEAEVLVLDGGRGEAGIESTVVSLMGDEPAVLRLGVVSAEQIEAVLGKKVGVRRMKLSEAQQAEMAKKGKGMGGPGVLMSHYSPRTRAVLMGTEEIRGGKGLPRGLNRAAVLVWSDVEVPMPHVAIRMPAEAGAYGQQLYGALHMADDMNATVIVIERPPEEEGDGGRWEAVLDRLERATAEK